MGGPDRFAYYSMMLTYGEGLIESFPIAEVSQKFFFFKAVQNLAKKN
jgi:hypothetical protein